MATSHSRNLPRRRPFSHQGVRRSLCASRLRDDPACAIQGRRLLGQLAVGRQLAADDRDQPVGPTVRAVIAHDVAAGHARLGLMRRVRQGAHQMGRDMKEPLAQRFAYEPELEMLQAAQSAVNEPRRSGGGPARHVALVEQEHTQPAQRGIPRDARAIDPGADNDQVEAGRSFRREVTQAAAPFGPGTIASLITSPRPIASSASTTSANGRWPLMKVPAGTIPFARNESAVST